MEKVSLVQYYEMLQSHDWYYSMSDDGRVYRKGLSNYHLMLARASQSQDHLSLFNGFKQHYSTGRPWNTEQAPKPDKPKE